jgi:hypothetical protein
MRKIRMLVILVMAVVFLNVLGIIGWRTGFVVWEAEPGRIPRILNIGGGDGFIESDTKDKSNFDTDSKGFFSRGSSGGTGGGGGASGGGGTIDGPTNGGSNPGGDEDEKTEPTTFLNIKDYDVSVGEEFDVVVEISTADNVFAMDLEINFDSEILEVVNVVEGNFLKKDGAQTFPLINFDNSEGKIEYASTRFGTSVGVTGEGGLILIEFKAIEKGESIISIVKGELVNVDIYKIKGIGINNGKSKAS